MENKTGRLNKEIAPKIRKYKKHLTYLHLDNSTLPSSKVNSDETTFIPHKVSRYELRVQNSFSVEN